MLLNRATIFCKALLFCFNISIAQTNTVVDFSILYGDQELIGNDSIALFKDPSSKLEISVLKFYVSNIHFLKNKKIVFAEKNSFHLIDLSFPSTQKIKMSKPLSVDFDEIAFSLGIDSITSVSGALGGDLDPMKGMYWAWQSGYINFKLEGKKETTQFILHLGGYQHPFYCLQQLVLPVNNSNPVKIVFDVKPFIERSETTHTKRIMSPGSEAMLLSKELRNYFRIESQ